MLKQYKLKVRIDGHYMIEDPKCPFEWRGSGCYDKEVKTWANMNLEVWAKSPKEAIKFVEEYDYAAGTEIEVDDVKILNVECFGYSARDADEAGVIEQTVNWKEYEY